jgi:hypothetical protein
MRLWGIVAVQGLALVATSLCRFGRASGEPAAESAAVGVAAADPVGPTDPTDPADPTAPRAPRVGYAAMPGGLHVATAETLSPGTVVLAALSGLGHRGGLLGKDHAYNRAAGDLAAAYAPLPSLVLGLSFNGSYDRHRGFDASNTGRTDDGYVGVPHALVRVGRPMGQIAFAGQLDVSAPGGDAPSIVVSAISAEARAIASLETPVGLVSLDAGFRLDHSARSVARQAALSVADQVSLGVSEFSAAVAGLSLRIPATRRGYVEFEGSADLFVGRAAPGPIVRGGAVVGIALGDALCAIGFIEAAKVPGIAYHDPMVRSSAVLIPYEPSVTGGVGLQARFGGPTRVQVTRRTIPLPEQVPVVVVETADVSGIVFDDAGRPVVGAKVTISLTRNTATTVTDGKGSYTFGKLPIGKTVDGRTELDDTGAEIVAQLASKKPSSVTLTLGKGPNPVPPITLDPQLPPGQLRGVIRSATTSRPIAGATVVIEPGGTTLTAGPDGKFTVDLPPGRYKITVTSRGLSQQQLDVNIEQNSVAIKNIELYR